MTGTIKTIVEGKPFGFIVRDGQTSDQKDLFFHKEKVAAGSNFEDLKAGDKVSFDEGMGEKCPTAENVMKAE